MTKPAMRCACSKKPTTMCTVSLVSRRRLACHIPRQVGATYKALWTKAKKNAEARHLWFTKRRFKGPDDAPKYVSPTLTYSYGRDYSLKVGQRVSPLFARLVVEEMAAL